ncbi:methylamine utilization protein [Rhodoferax ferrireducens]|uniref:methylamine utilization protein n=1 Tax=Rhodoferax ferrireducens TaxID=192843 RepID=UPI0018E4E41D|nr:methylamine utilization protein [Rhodoferax ferrireducens]
MTRATSAGIAAVLFICVNALAGGLEATVSTPAGKPVEDAAVVIEPILGAAPKPRRIATIEQRNREFMPYVTIVQTGTLIEFPNHDPVKHHIYSFSPAKLLEIKLYAGKPVQPVLFDKPGEVALGCNIHDWMEAYVLVVNSPYFAKTGRDGKALIRNLPAGHYRLRVWHPRQKAEGPQRDIEIGGTTTRLKLLADVTPGVVKPKPPVESDTY